MSDLIDVMAWKPSCEYTDEPMPIVDAWDGSTPIDIWRARVAKFMKLESARRNPMLTLRRDGVLIYRLTEGGNLHRTFQITGTRRREVLARDKSCVWCGSTKNLEIDHIIRYVDGGDESLENLRALCHECHGSRGGRT